MQMCRSVSTQPAVPPSASPGPYLLFLQVSPEATPHPRGLSSTGDAERACFFFFFPSFF